MQILSDLTRLASVAARGKRRSRDVARFLLDRASAVAELQEEIATRSYTPGIGRTFWVRDPKLRLIYALPFRDRVVQHLLMAQTLPFLEPSLAPQSYACRVGKGTHRCLERAAEWTRRRAYVLRLDMRKFFPSIDHAILRRLLQRTTPLPWRWLRDRFLDAPYVGEQVQYHFTGDDLLTPLQRPHGLPIGSLTSQLWANAYLSPLDHLLASHLGLGSFVRYCDDILVFDDDPGRLEDALRHLLAGSEALRLRLHPVKTRLFRTTDPVSFLGFVLQRHGDAVRIRLRHDNVERMRQRVRHMKLLYATGALGPEEVLSRLRAWLAHAGHGHTQRLLEREAENWRFQKSPVTGRARHEGVEAAR